MSDDRFQLVGRTLKDEFRVERFVAEGGFGVVYKATQITVGRDVALKVLKTPEDLNPEARAEYLGRFAAEARTLGKLAHPAIVQVLDFGVDPMGTEGDTAWMALEWIPGETLEDELKARRKQGGRSPAEAYALLRDVLRAVAHAHDLGTAHRDLKPANIMVVRGKRETTVRLLDFGIAKLMSPDEQAGSGATRTKSAQSACSPRYAAPEQLSGARTGPWSDVHALGLILTEVLTDRPVYPGKTLNALMVEALSRTRPSPAKFGVDVGAWEPVLARAVALRPDDRYPNAGDLLDALEAALPEGTRPSLVRATPAPALPAAAVGAALAMTADAPPLAHAATAPGPAYVPGLGATAVLPETPGDDLGATAGLERESFGPNGEVPLGTAATLYAMPARASAAQVEMPAMPGPSSSLGYAPTMAATPSPLADFLRPSEPQPSAQYQGSASYSGRPVAPMSHATHSPRPADHGAPSAYRTPPPAEAVLATPARNPVLLVVGIAMLVAVLGIVAFVLLMRGSSPTLAPTPTVTPRAALTPAPLTPAPLPPAPVFPSDPRAPVPSAPEPAAAPPADPAVAAPNPGVEAPALEPDAPQPDEGRRRGRRRRRPRRGRHGMDIE